jgi:hypothetical protein
MLVLVKRVGSGRELSPCAPRHADGGRRVGRRGRVPDAPA